MSVACAVSCTHSQRTTISTSNDLAPALEALERKVCLTIGNRTNGPGDQCEPQVDRATYIQPLWDVFRAAPPVLRAYLCSMDRIYIDYHLVWNSDSYVKADPQTRTAHLSIGFRRGLLEKKPRYDDWATGWTQHWWTGGAHDRPSEDRTLPRVETDLSGSSGVLFHLIAHEVAHIFDLHFGVGMTRQPNSAPFKPGEFGFLSWISPRYVDTNGVVHRAVARESALESVRDLDFEGNVNARLAMRNAAQAQGATWDAGGFQIVGWQPASRDGISTFLEQLDRSSFTTIFSTWRPEDDWAESFAMMMLPAITRKLDIITADGRRIRVLSKVLEESSQFAPKRRFIQQLINRALTDFRSRQASAPDACFTAALATAPMRTPPQP